MGSRWLEPLERWMKLAVLPPAGAAVIRALGRSMRIDTRGNEEVDRLYREGKRVIIAFWHARQLMMPLTYRGTHAHILISQHQDGEIIARIVERFGFRAVRGSSTRGGVEALRELIRLGRSGVDLVVTPDGPNGPPHVVKMGVIQLARAAKLPIIPLAFSCSKSNIASEYASSPVAQPATQMRISSLSGTRSRTSGITCFSRKSNASGSLKNRVTPMSRS